MNVFRLRIKNYIQPFERRLAMQELRTLSSAEPTPIGPPVEGGCEFELRSAVSRDLLTKRLAFWECVDADGRSALTLQTLREATVHTARNGVALKQMGLHLPFKDHVPLPNRRCLRYGPHGIHEYRGKFFPQLVRSLINISGIRESGFVVDPMCGSGTTVAEALLSARRTVGFDINPLSVFIATTKCRVLAADASTITRAYERISRQLRTQSPRRATRLAYFSRLPEADQSYLAAWFSPKVLNDLDTVVQAIHAISDTTSRDLMLVSLSNILRRVSWQKADDLRVRKDVRDDEDIEAREEFLAELERSVRSVLALLYQNGPITDPRFEVREVDARECGNTLAKDSVDLVITSPPYATALPYLDTDRLSLSYLGLLSRSRHRARDQQMIGNREITDATRRAYWELFERHAQLLPDSVRGLIRRIRKLNSSASVGFRRLNLPSLLANYFFDMRRVLEGMHRVLKPGSLAFVVVGNNHTFAGSQRVEIETAKHLQEIGAAVGFRVAESLKMEMLVSRDIFRRNATQSEEILALYKVPKA